MSSDLSTDASGSKNITMATRRSERISQTQSHPEYNTDIICYDSGHDADLEQVEAPAPRKRRGSGCGGRGGRGVSQGSGRRGQPTPGSSNTTATSNSNEGQENRKADTSTEMEVDDLKAALGATCEEVTSFMRSVTSVLCTLFSVLTATQIQDIEKSTNVMMKEDNLFNKCINHAKSAAAVRDLAPKLASARNASNKEEINSPTNEATVKPQSITHNINTGAGVAAAPKTNSNAQIPRSHMQNGDKQSNEGWSNNEISSTNQTTNTARPDWLRKLDEDRKYNLILFGIHDTNNKNEDHRIVDDVLWTIGCQHRIANKTNIIRLGNKKPGRSRLLMVCFNSETAASQVLNRSTNLVRSASLGHIYIKRDLPRDQRPLQKTETAVLQKLPGVHLL